MANTTERRLLRILVTPLNGHGHINACHGLCEELRDRGHQVIFLIDADFAGRLKKYGFEERLLPRPEKTSDDDESKEFWQLFIERNVHKFSLPPLAQMTELIPYIFTTMFEMQKGMEQPYEREIEKIKPDLIIHDGYICFPTVVNQSIPWVWLFSASPQALLVDSRLPPFYSGLPLDKPSEWKHFNEEMLQALGPLQKAVSEYNEAEGGEPVPVPRVHPFSKHLNLYMSPEELRYTHIDIPSNVVGVDCFVRTMPDLKFDLPQQLQDKPGKLIFFSMGSFGCANLPMMTRLVAMLAKSPNRFIVSKGPLKYDMPGDNLWGEPFLPQTAILPIVDLVITHGGNNTVTETFFYGKPMLVLPQFADQHDNAQRIKEVGLGDKLNPFTCTEDELLNAIETLLANDELAQRMERIGQRIRASKDKQKVAHLIEQLVH